VFGFCLGPFNLIRLVDETISFDDQLRQFETFQRMYVYYIKGNISRHISAEKLFWINHQHLQ